MPEPRTTSASSGQVAQLSPPATRPPPRFVKAREAFFPDEWGPKLTERGLHEHLYDTKGTTFGMQAPNPLFDATLVPSPELTPRELALVKGGKHFNDPGYWIFVPEGASSPFEVTVLFAVGTEMLRHGIRGFCDQAGRVLVVVSGVESGWDLSKPIGRAWGVGITKEILSALFAKVGHPDAEFTIKVLAAYSTGYRGIASTINAFAGTETLELSSVSNVVFFDAFYRGDEPKPGKNTQRALTAIDELTGHGARVVVYEVTNGGTPARHRRHAGRAGVAHRDVRGALPAHEPEAALDGALGPHLRAHVRRSGARRLHAPREPA